MKDMKEKKDKDAFARMRTADAVRIAHLDIKMRDDADNVCERVRVLLLGKAKR